jgi:hypothetical protein
VRKQVIIRRHLRAALALTVIVAAVAVAVSQTLPSTTPSAAARNTQAARIEPEAFHTTHELRTKTGDGRDMVVLSGYAEIDGNDLRGNPDGSWNRKDLVFRIGPDWKSVDAVPVVSMSSIMNAGVAKNAGWAVDRCEQVDVTTPSQGKRYVRLECRVAVRDSDGFMFRVNYYVTMVGRLA